MKVLALEPYYGGSHQAFLDGWARHSRHRFTRLTLPAHKWKWRMRHGAVTMASQVRSLADQGETWDALFASDMLNLAEFRGLAPAAVAGLPSCVYFHENQLTYPVRQVDERDLHFALTNFTTAVAAEQLVFNSLFHQNEFLTALDALLGRMPDYHCAAERAALPSKARVIPPGVEPILHRGNSRPAGPLRIAWAARWEHDKGPQAFFAALAQLQQRGVPFRVSVLGESFREVPDVFATARELLAGQIDHWGYQASRADYLAALGACDLFVSTADHEFFGISVVEAILAGAYPVLPRRLAYPEVLRAAGTNDLAEFFYDGGVESLVSRLCELAERQAAGDLWPGDPRQLRRRVERCEWPVVATELDDLMAELAARPSRR